MFEGSVSIAVIDDEVQLRSALGRLLRSYGCEVALFEDGASFLKAHRERPYRCILLDLHMPGLNGFDVLGELSRQRSIAPVIVITGKDDPGNADRVLALGASSYLEKPVDEIHLIAAVTRALETAGPERAGSPQLV